MQVGQDSTNSILFFNTGDNPDSTLTILGTTGDARTGSQYIGFGVTIVPAWRTFFPLLVHYRVAA